MKPSLDLEILDRYLSGEQTPEDMGHIENWAVDNIERKRLLNSLMSRALPPDRDGREWNGHDMWAEFEQVLRKAPVGKISSARTAPRLQTVTQQKRGHDNFAVPFLKSRPVFAGIAATLILLAVGFIASGTFGPFNQHVSSWTSKTGREIITAAGQRTTIELADGSRVLVAPESKLTIPENLGTRARIIEVEGEVYVTVVQDAARPFIVRTDDVETRVLGTRFSVRKYPEDTVVRVAVVDGRVAVGDAVVGAGDVARAVPRGVVTVHAEMDVERYLEWSRGVLRFDDQPLSQVIRELSRAYGVEIKLADTSLENEKVTAEFDNQPVGTMLKYLSLALNVDLEQFGNTAVLSLRSSGKSVSLPPSSEENE